MKKYLTVLLILGLLLAVDLLLLAMLLGLGQTKQLLVFGTAGVSSSMLIMVYQLVKRQQKSNSTRKNSELEIQTPSQTKMASEEESLIYSDVEDLLTIPGRLRYQEKNKRTSQTSKANAISIWRN